MLLQGLELVQYPRERRSPPGSRWGPWESLRSSGPAWEAVVEGIEQLDRDEFPLLYLHLAEPEEWEQPMHAMQVCGGLGEYSVCLWLPSALLEYRDASRGAEDVEIWRSDQGASLPACELCNDLAVVIRIARHFADTGAPLETVSWESRDRV